MAYIVEIGHGREKRFKVRERLPHGRTVNRTFRGKGARRAAEKFAEALATDIRRGDWMETRHDGMTFREWVEHLGLLENHRSHKSSKSRALLRRHLLPEIANRELASIDYLDIERLIGGFKRKGLSRDYADKSFQLLRQVFEKAVRIGAIKSSPCYRPERDVFPRRPNSERQIIGPAEIDRLANALEQVRPQYRLIAPIGGYAGAGLAEAGALKRNDFNPIKKTLSFKRSLSNDGNYTGGKKETRAATLRIPQILVDEINRHIGQFGIGHDDFLFTSPTGQQFNKKNFTRRHWKKAVDLAGLPNLKPYDLRHSCATLLALAGQHPKVAQQYLRHKDIRMTMQVYTHLFGGWDEGAAAALDRVAADRLDRLPSVEKESEVSAGQGANRARDDAKIEHLAADDERRRQTQSRRSAALK